MVASENPRRRSSGAARRWLIGAAIVCVPGIVVVAQNLQSGQLPAEPPTPPRNPSIELAMKIQAPFTLTSVGDVMIKRPASTLEEPTFQSLVKLLQDADIAVGNMEGNLADIPHFDGPLRGMMGSKDVARDLKTMGFDLMNRANNHVFDSDVEGLVSTIDQLDEAGIVHAGTGKNLEDARRPAFLDTPKGRVAIVGMHSPNNDNAVATNQVGNVGGRPGINALRFTTFHNITREQLEAIKQIRRAVYAAPPGTTNTVKLPESEPADRVQLFGLWYKVGAPGTKNFEMNRSDLQGILRSIRNGKYLSDFVVATIHAHQGPITAQQWLFEDQVPDFLIDLAHQAIDNGADAFVGHGPHVLRGIEIYKGKPIFYGLGEFFYQWQHMDASLMSGSWVGDGEAPDVRNPMRAINFQSLLTQSRFDKGKLVEVRLHPVSGQFDGPISQLGMPRAAPPEMAQQILKRVQSLSQAFGTTVTIEGNVGVVRVSGGPASTATRQ